MKRVRALAAILLLAAVAPIAAQPLTLPTANRHLFDPGAAERFYAPTPGKTWTSGCFGCSRSDGRQFHEGIDILRTTTDRAGEPTDPVRAAAAGSVAYINHKAGESSFGKYVVLRHDLEGIRIYTLYAHLRDVAAGLQPGAELRAGDAVGILGRTTNTKTRIARERAHLHFEISLVLSDQFDRWHRENYQGARNEHGVWNGRNFQGLDPAEVLQRQQREGTGFSLLDYIRQQPELFRVLVPKNDFFYARFYRPLMRRNPVAEREGIKGFEIVFNFAGVPCQLIPRAASEVTFGAGYRLLSVNEAEQKARGCRDFVVRQRGTWALSRTAVQLLDLLTCH